MSISAPPAGPRPASPVDRALQEADRARKTAREELDEFNRRIGAGQSTTHAGIDRSRSAVTRSITTLARIRTEAEEAHHATIDTTVTQLEELQAELETARQQDTNNSVVRTAGPVIRTLSSFSTYLSPALTTLGDAWTTIHDYVYEPMVAPFRANSGLRTAAAGAFRVVGLAKVADFIQGTGVQTPDMLAAQGQRTQFNEGITNLTAALQAAGISMTIPLVGTQPAQIQAAGTQLRALNFLLPFLPPQTVSLDRIRVVGALINPALAGTDPIGALIDAARRAPPVSATVAPPDPLSAPHEPSINAIALAVPNVGPSVAAFQPTYGTLPDNVRAAVRARLVARLGAGWDVSESATPAPNTLRVRPALPEIPVPAVFAAVQPQITVLKATPADAAALGVVNGTYATQAPADRQKLILHLARALPAQSVTEAAAPVRLVIAARPASYAGLDAITPVQKEAIEDLALDPSAAKLAAVNAFYAAPLTQPQQEAIVTFLRARLPAANARRIAAPVSLAIDIVT